MTSALESAAYIKAEGDKEFKQFSVQQLVDCDSDSYGCRGGGINDAFDYYKDTEIILEENYPYEAKDGFCRSTQR